MATDSSRANRRATTVPLPVLTASYTWRDWQFSLSWANLFDSHYKAYENELLNRDLYKHTIGYSNGNGNQVSINISWHASAVAASTSPPKSASTSAIRTMASSNKTK